MLFVRGKYRSHTDPLFKATNLLKLTDMYKISSMKFYHKYVNERVPLYFVDIFKKKTLSHIYETRNRHVESPFKPKHKLLETALRYSMHFIISTLPPIVNDKICTHFLNGFSSYMKKFLTSKYTDECTDTNCFICKND